MKVVSWRSCVMRGELPERDVRAVLLGLRVWNRSYGRVCMPFSVEGSAVLCGGISISEGLARAIGAALGGVVGVDG